MSKTELLDEFDRQLDTLIENNYPKIAKLSVEAFQKNASSLRSKLKSLKLTDLDLEKGSIPFVIVVKGDLVPTEKMMELVERDGVNGVTILRPNSSKDFKVINDVSIPKMKIYLLIDIDRGKQTINLPPKEAIKLIKEAGRSPLTIDEGIAIVTHFPEFLVKNNCFSLLASRTGSDQRVPAIWINAKKEPNLGWCWDGNPHTWLGSASCMKRID